MTTSRSRMTLIALALAALSLTLAPAAAQALPTHTPDQTAFETDGRVEAIARAGGITYIGGRFTELRAHTGGFAVLSTASGQRTGAFPEIEGEIHAIAPDGAGGFYVGGTFSRVGRFARSNLAHVLADGRVDYGFRPNPNDSVLALAVADGAVYAGGHFTTIAGAVRNRIAKLSATSGNAFSGFNPDANMSVRALVVSGAELYAGGLFTSIGGQQRDRIAKLSTTSGNAFSAWNPQANGAVHALAVSGSELYVGGGFAGAESIGGQARDRIAKLSTASGNAFSGFNPDADAVVRTLAVGDGAVYAGGSFSSIGGEARKFVAKLSATTGNAFSGFGPNPDEAVKALALSGETLYAGGSFTRIGGASRNRIAKLSTASGDAFSAFNPNADGLVNALAVSGTAVVAGGEFANVNVVKRSNIAALDSGGVPTAFNPKADGEVLALEVSGDGLFVGGQFTSIGGRTRNNIAKLSTASGNAFSGFDPNATGYANESVRDFVLDGSVLYVAGQFGEIGGVPRKHIAKLSTATGSAFSGFAPDANSNVLTLSLSDSGLYAGGNFTEIGGQPRAKVAKLSTTSGNAYRSFDAGAVSCTVLALVVAEPSLYVGGCFYEIGGSDHQHLARLSTTTGDASEEFEPRPNRNGFVRSLALSEDALYVGGQFTTLGGLTRNRIAAVSPATGDAFAAFNPSATGDDWDEVSAITASSSAVHIGGSFNQIRNRNRQGYAQFTTP